MDGIHVWDDFSGGEWGRLGDLKAPKGSWSGLNVMRYLDGGIGPRPGFVDVTPASGLPTSGEINAFGTLHTDRGYHNVVLFAVMASTGNVYAWGGMAGSTPATPGAVAGPAATTIPAPGAGWMNWVNDPAMGADAGDVFISNAADIFQIHGSAGLSGSAPTVTVTKIASGPPAPGPLAFYGDRLLCASNPFGTPTLSVARLYYSDPRAYTTWPVGQYVDVGDSAPISALIPFRDRVFIFKGGEVWQLIGTLGFNAEIRFVGNFRGPALQDPRLITLLANSAIWSSEHFTRAPALFDGLNVQSLYHLELAPDASSPGVNYPPYVSRAARVEDLIVYGRQTDLLTSLRGVWNRWSLGLPNANARFAAPWFSTGFWIGQSVAGGPKIYYLDTNVDRPASTSDGVRRPGDVSSTPVAASLTLPRLFAPVGGAIKLRKLFFDGTKYNTGSASTNHFDVTVTASHTDGGTGSNTASGGQSFDEATSAAGAVGAGVADRYEMHLGDQGWGGSVQVAITNIRGWKFDRVTALYETRKAAA